MSNLLFLVGNSNSGKDYIADQYYRNYSVLKCNQAFKDIYELDHLLPAGTCNDKTKRQEIHKNGPMTGNTIQDGMVKAYQHSLTGYGYGHKFKTLTILATLNSLEIYSKNRTPVVITDLRKESELIFILEFCKLINYSVEMVQVISNKSKPLASDNSLYNNISLFTHLTHKTVKKHSNNR